MQPFDFSSLLNIFWNFISRYCIGLHFPILWSPLQYDFYPFVYLCCVVITELVFDFFFPRPKGDD